MSAKFFTVASFILALVAPQAMAQPLALVASHGPTLSRTGVSKTDAPAANSRYCGTDPSRFASTTKQYFRQKTGCDLNQQSLVREFNRALGLNASDSKLVSDDGASLEEGTFRARLQEQIRITSDMRPRFERFYQALSSPNSAALQANAEYAMRLAQAESALKQLVETVSTVSIHKPRALYSSELYKIVSRALANQPLLASEQGRIVRILTGNNTTLHGDFSRLDLRSAERGEGAQRLFPTAVVRELLAGGVKTAMATIDRNRSTYVAGLKLASKHGLSPEQLEERHRLVGELVVGYEVQKQAALLESKSPQAVEALAQLDLLRPGLCSMTQDYNDRELNGVIKESLTGAAKATGVTALLIWERLGPIGPLIGLGLATKELAGVHSDQPLARCGALQMAILDQNAAEALSTRSPEQWQALRLSQQAQVESCNFQAGLEASLAVAGVGTAVLATGGTAAARTLKVLPKLANGATGNVLRGIEAIGASGVSVKGGMITAGIGLSAAGVSVADICAALRENPDPANPYGCFKSAPDFILGVAQFGAVAAHGAHARKRLAMAMAMTRTQARPTMSVSAEAAVTSEPKIKVAAVAEEAAAEVEPMSAPHNAKAPIPLTEVIPPVTAESNLKLLPSHQTPKLLGAKPEVPRGAPRRVKSAIEAFTRDYEPRTAADRKRYVEASKAIAESNFTSERGLENLNALENAYYRGRAPEALAIPIEAAQTRMSLIAKSLKTPAAKDSGTIKFLIDIVFSPPGHPARESLRPRAVRYLREIAAANGSDSVLRDAVAEAMGRAMNRFRETPDLRTSSSVASQNDANSIAKAFGIDRQMPELAKPTEVARVADRREVNRLLRNVIREMPNAPSAELVSPPPPLETANAKPAQLEPAAGNPILLTTLATVAAPAAPAKPYLGTVPAEQVDRLLVLARAARKDNQARSDLKNQLQDVVHAIRKRYPNAPSEIRVEAQRIIDRVTSAAGIPAAQVPVIATPGEVLAAQNAEARTKLRPIAGTERTALPAMRTTGAVAAEPIPLSIDSQEIRAAIARVPGGIKNPSAIGRLVDATLEPKPTKRERVFLGGSKDKERIQLVRNGIKARSARMLQWLQEMGAMYGQEPEMQAWVRDSLTAKIKYINTVAREAERRRGTPPSIAARAKTQDQINQIARAFHIQEATLPRVVTDSEIALASRSSAIKPVGAVAAKPTITRPEVKLPTSAASDGPLPLQEMPPAMLLPAPNSAFSMQPAP